MVLLQFIVNCKIGYIYIYIHIVQAVDEHVFRKRGEYL
jgi:hypothetical protein